ncbi:MAG: PASTA domain-containing protein [Bacteroidota bacterium]
MKEWINFFKTRAFAANLAVAGLIVLLLSFLAFRYLSAITHHGESVEVPKVVGKSMAEAEEILDDADLEYKIIDSVFRENMPKGYVVDQKPDAMERVKDGRTIYLTVNASNAPKVDMPDLVNQSLRQAVTTLNAIGLKYETVYRPDICTDCVLAQMYRGRSIVPGFKIAKGEMITLVLGQAGMIDSTATDSSADTEEEDGGIF